MNLNELNKEIPYKWKVHSFSEKKPQVKCVAYIDARIAQKLLDEVCGKDKWQSVYYEACGLLFCKVGIKINDEWMWKSDTGKEGKYEKEKSHSSDAFKRACVHWGIGRFLYRLGIVYLKTNGVKQGKKEPDILDDFGNKIWNLTEYINNRNRNKKSNIKKEVDENRDLLIVEIQGMFDGNEWEGKEKAWLSNFIQKTESKSMDDIKKVHTRMTKKINEK